MVAYQPPDEVLVAVGASFKSGPLLEAAERVRAAVENDGKELARFGIDDEAVERLEAQIRELRRTVSDPRAQKNDTPLQMAEVADTMARLRGWLKTLRMIASINLTLDAPALERICSVAPEVPEGYARDFLEEVKKKIKTAADMKPRLEEVGLDDAFLSRGRRLAKQLQTAIGKVDVDADNLHLTIRRLYMRKAQLYLSLKRITRAGQVAFLSDPSRAAPYHLEEIEPVYVDDPRQAKHPKKAGLSAPGMPAITRPPGRP